MELEFYTNNSISDLRSGVCVLNAECRQCPHLPVSPDTLLLRLEMEEEAIKSLRQVEECLNEVHSRLEAQKDSKYVTRAPVFSPSPSSDLGRVQ